MCYIDSLIMILFVISVPWHNGANLTCQTSYLLSAQTNISDVFVSRAIKETATVAGSAKFLTTEERNEYPIPCKTQKKLNVIDQPFHFYSRSMVNLSHAIVLQRSLPSIVLRRERQSGLGGVILIIINLDAQAVDLPLKH